MKDQRCDVCSYATGEPSKLREHVRIMHTHRHVKPYKCAYCPFTSATSGNCRKHVAQRHPDLEVKVDKVTPDPVDVKPVANTVESTSRCDVTFDAAKSAPPRQRSKTKRVLKRSKPETARLLSSRIPSQALRGAPTYVAHLDDTSSSMSSLASAVAADTAVQVPDTSRYRRILPKGCVDVSHVTPAVALYPVNSVLPLLPEAYSHVAVDSSCSPWSQLEPASNIYQPAPATVAVGDDSTHEHVILPQAPADHDGSLAVVTSTATFQAPLNPHTDSKEVISFVHSGHDATSGSDQTRDSHVHVTGV